MSAVKMRLSAARVNAGLTQKQVACKLKVSTRTIVNWENGYATPSAASLNMLSDIYGIPVDTFLLQQEST